MKWLLFFLGVLNVFTYSISEHAKYTRDAMGPEDIEHDLLHKALLEDIGKFSVHERLKSLFSFLLTESMIILL